MNSHNAVGLGYDARVTLVTKTSRQKIFSMRLCALL